jgi:hypothetical protein
VCVSFHFSPSRLGMRFLLISHVFAQVAWIATVSFCSVVSVAARFSHKRLTSATGAPNGPSSYDACDVCGGVGASCQVIGNRNRSARDVDRISSHVLDFDVWFCPTRTVLAAPTAQLYMIGAMSVAATARRAWTAPESFKAQQCSCDYSCDARRTESHFVQI